MALTQKKAAGGEWRVWRRLGPEAACKKTLTPHHPRPPNTQTTLFFESPRHHFIYTDISPNARLDTAVRALSIDRKIGARGSLALPLPLPSPPPPLLPPLFRQDLRRGPVTPPRARPNDAAMSPATSAAAAARPGAWAPEEDRRLEQLVRAAQGKAKHGEAISWTLVARALPGRSGKSCRLR